jgi:hypothetical protein
VRYRPIIGRDRDRPLVANDVPPGAVDVAGARENVLVEDDVARGKKTTAARDVNDSC